MMRKNCLVVGAFKLVAACLVAASIFSFSQAADPVTPEEKAASDSKASDRSRSRQRSADAFRREYGGSRTVQPSAPPARNTRDAVRPADDVPQDSTAPGPKATVLVLDYAQFKIGNDLVNLRTYNGRLVGPTIRVKAGETLYLELINQLPFEPEAMAGDMKNDLENAFHNWNTTNLHFHGLHVAPQGACKKKPDTCEYEGNKGCEYESDNVFVKLKPTMDPFGSVQKYAVEIPSNHPAGTFWFHPHVHGSTTPQVASGASGALIVEGNQEGFENNKYLDNNPEVAAATAKEEILVLQQIPYLIGPAGIGEIENVGQNASKMFDPGSFKALRRYTTVNGELIPTIHMRPGEVRRFRFVASQQRETINLSLLKNASAHGPVSIDFHEIALDGLPTGGIESKTKLELFPGYRSDSLVQAPLEASGEYDLINLNASDVTGADGSPEPLNLVARVIISGAPYPMQLPGPNALSAYRYRLDIPAQTTATEEYAFYGIVLKQAKDQNGNQIFDPITKEPVTEAYHYISRSKGDRERNAVLKGKEYDHEDSPRKLTLGQVQKWVVGSRNYDEVNQSTLGVTHPFHIHINPFLVTKIEDDKGKDLKIVPVWRDTLAMKQGYTYTLITEYEDYTGCFVDHCHILDHEDLGMMERVEIVAPGASAAKAGVPIFDSPTKLPVVDPTKPTVALFVKGSFCPHCMSQLTNMAKGIGSSKVNLVVVSAADKADLEDFPVGPFSLVADPKHTLFQQNGAFKREPLHATIVFDTAGKTVLKEVGSTPYTDVEAVRKAVSAK